uniref:Nucleolar complex protein 2 n=1 Tax=Anthurium amnicola TaxID=1678845 RepID=A0A1D1XP02_9ARAE
MSDIQDSDKSNGKIRGSILSSKKAAKEHMEQMQRLQEKDPEFYQFLKDHDKELLEFNDEGFDEEGATDLEKIDSQDIETDLEGDEPQFAAKKMQKSSRKIITTAMVDLWSAGIKDRKLSSIRALLRAFRAACHYGDDDFEESSPTLSIVSSSVFNRIMLVVLNEMDKSLRELLKLPSSGGKRETIVDLMRSKLWMKYGSLVRSYLGNALDVLNQMTDEQMVSFTIKRIKSSAVFLAAFPILLRKYIKVLIHFWGTGGGALQVVSFLFLRDLCLRLGPDCLDTCLRGMYKAYVWNCQIKGKYASASKLKHIHFLGNCVAEVCGVDLSIAYQHAFIFVRQLATILRGTLTEKPNVNFNKKTKGGSRKTKDTESEPGSKKAYLKVYDWQFISCLELWTGVICAYSSETDFRLLAYPLTQIIFGVARLVPTARYFPVRLHCARMLNRISASTGSFIPLSLLLLDVLEWKELNSLPDGGVGKAVDLLTRKLVGKPTLKTRAFQEACIHAVVEQLAEHLAQWSYSIAFFELSFIPIVRLRSFCKSTTRFRKEIRELIRQVECNAEFMNARRGSIELSPNNPAAAAFLQVEKEAGISPLSQFVADLRRRSQQRNDSIAKSSVLVGEKSSVFGSKLSKTVEEEDGDDDDDDGGSDEGAAVFCSSWLPNPNAGLSKAQHSKKKRGKKHDKDSTVGTDEDVVEDLILSSDDDEAPGSDLLSEYEEHEPEQPHLKVNKKRKPSAISPKKNRSSLAKKTRRK